MVLRRNDPERRSSDRARPGEDAVYEKREHGRRQNEPRGRARERDRELADRLLRAFQQRSGLDREIEAADGYRDRLGNSPGAV